MENSKLIQILRTLSSIEIRKFSEFVQSPYFNKNKNVIDLMQILHKQHPKYSAKQASKQNIHKLMFKGKVFDEKDLRYPMSDLTKLLEEFLTIAELNDHVVLKKHFQLKAFNRRNLEKQFPSLMKDAFKEIEKDKFRDTDYYFRKFLLEEDAFEFTFKHFNHAHKNNLQQVVENLDVFYLATKLKYCCEIINNRNTFKFDQDTLMLDEILNFLKKNSYEHIPLISIYHKILLTLIESEDEQHFTDLRDLLTKFSTSFPVEEQHTMFVYALNYCVHRINKGNSGYLRQYFEIFKQLIDREIVFVDGNLTQWDYKNMVTTGLRLKETDWVADFIKLYKNKIREDHRENAYKYNQAHLKFFQKKYDDTIKLLSQVEFTDIYYHLDSKSLLLKTYYEKREIESFFSLVDAFKVYLSRNKLISDYQRTTYRNLVKLTHKMFKAKLIGDKKGEAFLSEIQNTNPLSNVSWLKQKAEELVK